VEVSTSQETRYVSATEPNRLMLLGEIVARNTQIQSACSHWALKG
jgi:hypothetical protein